MRCAIWLGVSQYRDRASARSRVRAALYPPPPDQSPRAAWRSGRATAQSADGPTCMATVCDPVDPLAIDLLRDEIEAKLLAHYTGEEAADRMLLPARRLHDRRNGGARRGPQHGDHPRLFRGRPALPLLVSCDACFSPATFLASGLAWVGGVRGALALRAGRLGCSSLA